MAKKLATGPFQVPVNPDTFGFITNFFNDTLNIVLKNHSDNTRKVKVKVEKCTTVLYPATSAEVDLLPETEVELKEGECTVLSVIINAFDILRVEIKGEIDEDLEKMEVSITGGKGNPPGSGRLLFADATLFFRHENLEEVD